MYIWARLEHKNVLPLLGFFLEGGEFPHLISEWMVKGTLHDYKPYLGDDMVVAMVSFYTFMSSVCISFISVVSVWESRLD